MITLSYEVYTSRHIGNRNDCKLIIIVYIRELINNYKSKQ